MMAAPDDTTNKILEFALWYQSLGWSVIPVARGAKRPGVTWESWQHERPSAQYLRSWYEGIYKGCGVGLVTGEISGNVFVVDVDTGEGKDGEDSLMALFLAHDDFPETATARTGGGGMHFFFIAPPGVKIKTGKDILGPGIDIRGEGGFIVLPPSAHPSGDVYRWKKGLHPGAIEIAESPDWLIDLVKDENGVFSPDWKQSQSAPHTPGASDGGVTTDAFGKVVDGRDEYMRNLVWATALELARECPIEPTAQILFDMVWPVYERNVRKRGQDLEQDGRGKGAMLEKCRYAVKRWAKVLQEAGASPRRPDGHAGGGDTGGGATADTPPRPPPAIHIQTAADFVAGFKPPVFLIDDIAQRSYFYSLTGPTGSGKTAVALLMAFCVATGTPLGHRAVERGRVLFLAGENPDDVRARFILMCEAFEIEAKDADIHFCANRFSFKDAGDLVRQEASAKGPFDLVIVDTAAAFFGGDDENSNAQTGDYARMLRGLVDIEGKPCILVPWHPIKNPSKDNLQPRGGGAIIAEVDGNLSLWSADQGDTTELHWCGKIRGPGFDPMSFKLDKRTSENLLDAKGRKIGNVVAVPMGADEEAAKEAATRRDEDYLLEAMLHAPKAAMRTWCQNMGWMTVKGEQMSRLQNTLARLERDKLVRRYRGKWTLTENGKGEAERGNMRGARDD